jgi:ABC-type lipopolysaccharide export system ATPase subunit
MAKFGMRLIQRITEQGSGDFIIEAASAEAAAVILLTAYKVAQAQGSSIVKLQDGQVQVLERSEVLDRSVSFMLLDEDGAEVRPVTAPNGRGS